MRKPKSMVQFYNIIYQWLKEKTGLTPSLSEDMPKGHAYDVGDRDRGGLFLMR